MLLKIKKVIKIIICMLHSIISCKLMQFISLLRILKPDRIYEGSNCILTPGLLRNLENLEKSGNLIFDRKIRKKSGNVISHLNGNHDFLL